MIAFDLNIPYSTYDNYYHGETPFPPDLLEDLFRITGDKRIINFFLKPLGLIAINNPEPDTKDDDTRGLIENTTINFGELVKKYQKGRQIMEEAMEIIANVKTLEEKAKKK